MIETAEDLRFLVARHPVDEGEALMEPKSVSVILRVRCLRAVYELAGGHCDAPVPHALVLDRLQASPEEADLACGFWVEREMIDWSMSGLRLTREGERRAQRYERSGWSSAPF